MRLSPRRDCRVAVVDGLIGRTSGTLTAPEAASPI
jgi:hypothetical protein